MEKQEKVTKEILEELKEAEVLRVMNDEIAWKLTAAGGLTYICC